MLVRSVCFGHMAELATAIQQLGLTALDTVFTAFSVNAETARRLRKNTKQHIPVARVLSGVSIRDISTGKLELKIKLIGWPMGLTAEARNIRT